VLCEPVDRHRGGVIISRKSFSSSKVTRCSSWPRSVAGTRPPLLRLVCLARFLTSDGACTPFGLACAPCAVGRAVPKHDRRRLWGPHTVALHLILRSGGYSSSGFNSSTEFHPCTAAASFFPAGEPTDKPATAPSEVWCPFSVFPAARSHISPVDPDPPVMLRPQGFAPSRRLAPRATSRACFIPVPLLGFRSSRPCSTRAAVRHSWRRAPPGVPTDSEESARPSRGPAQRAQPDHDAQGLARPSCRVPPRASSPPRCLASGGRWTGSPTASPHVLFRFGLHAGLTAGTPGCFRRRRSRSLSRPARPPWSSLPRWSSRPFGSAVGRGHDFPSEAAAVASGPAFPFALPPRFLPEPGERTASVATRSDSRS
jgi:hypothetical protein